MRLKILKVMVVFVILGIASLVVFSPMPTVSAESLLQETPSLDGYKIYFTEANEESSRFDRSINGISRFAGLLSEQGAQLETLEWRASFPTDADLVIVAGPLEDFNAGQTARLWNYITDGGKILLLVEPLRMQRGRPMGIEDDSGLMELLWADLGVRVHNDVVVTEGIAPPAPDASSDADSVEGGVEAEATPEATDEPVAETTPEPVVASAAVNPPMTDFTTANFSDSQPILNGINGSLAFFTARSIELDLSIREFPVQPLVFSNSDFYGENNIPAFYDAGVALYNIGEDVPSGFLPLAIAHEDDATGARVVLIGDRDFATNGAGLRSSPPNTGAFLYPDNVRFLLNSVAWLLGAETVAVTFPTPGPTATPTAAPTPLSAEALASDADLAVSINVSNSRPVEGEIIIYDISVLNNGPDTVPLVVVTDELPDGIAYILGSGGAFDGTTNRWIIEGLAPDQGTTLRMVVEVRRGTAGTTIVNTVTVGTELINDPDTDNNSASAEIQVFEARSFTTQPTQEG